MAWAASTTAQLEQERVWADHLLSVKHIELPNAYIEFLI